MKSHVRPLHNCVFRNMKYDRLVDGYVQDRSRSYNRQKSIQSYLAVRVRLELRINGFLVQFPEDSTT